MFFGPEDSTSGQAQNWMEASLEQLSTPLPPWAIRAGEAGRGGGQWW